jgi:hypothetical protein
MEGPTEDVGRAQSPTHVEQESSDYVVLLVFLSGDDDYGALHAKEFGTERIIDNILNGVSEIDDAFNYTHDIYVYNTDEQRKMAVRMMYFAINHVGDYDYRKHDDVIYRELTKDEYALYCRNAMMSSSNDTSINDDMSSEDSSLAESDETL